MSRRKEGRAPVAREGWSPRRWRWVLASAMGLVITVAAASEPAAGTADAALPQGAEQLLSAILADEQFMDCVVDALPASREELVSRIVSAGVAHELYDAVTEGMEAPEALLGDFVSTTADADRVLAEKAVHLMAVQGRDGVAVSGDPRRVYGTLNKALGMPCDAPAPDVGLQATLAQIEPLLVESRRVKTCAASEAEKRGLDETGALALLERDPDASKLRAHVMRLIEAVQPAADQRAQLDRADLPTAVLALLMFSAPTFDMHALARAEGIHAVYLDRALDAGCNPSKELVEYLGVP